VIFVVENFLQSYFSPFNIFIIPLHISHHQRSPQRENKGDALELLCIRRLRLVRNDSSFHGTINNE
jgi:hypothetical protein